MLEGEKLREFAAGASISWSVSRDAHHGRRHVVQGKGARVAEEISIAKLHLISQSVEHLVDLEVVV